jgi:hypothetical protein
MLHRVSVKFGWGTGRIENRTHFARGTLVCQEETYTISWVMLSKRREGNLGSRVEQPRFYVFALITYVKVRKLVTAQRVVLRCDALLDEVLP